MFLFSSHPSPPPIPRRRCPQVSCSRFLTVFPAKAACLGVRSWVSTETLETMWMAAEGIELELTSFVSYLHHSTNV